MKNVYLEGGHTKVLEASGISKNDLQFFMFPSDEEVNKSNLQIAHWSYFENWDPYRNYLVAKEFCGLSEADQTNSGTFTNFAQNDQALYALHTYLMYLKFGFGRATQDVGIEVRRGAMTREQGLNLVNLYDAYYPEEFTQFYLDYYQISETQFNDILDKWANKDLFTKQNKGWVLKKEIT